ncbi:hypothetical protein D3OALGA1CA_4601 [Olavius algarvensis associated proteobacterium Delta 3]|nr:hypothetical protein D3OALGB2SA_2611 [Olavius algarvensis associated proteobacterium Delta 3]CAB5154003.1 hypothetical protein D3OALGA1CA_4601 [Olavius algarvensis associated proteobacterium Delta 3]
MRSVILIDFLYNIPESIKFFVYFLLDLLQLCNILSFLNDRPHCLQIRKLRGKSDSCPAPGGAGTIRAVDPFIDPDIAPKGEVHGQGIS